MPVTVTIAGQNPAAIPNVQKVVVTGERPHDGYGNPGRGVTRQLTFVVSRNAEHRWIQHGFKLTTNDNGNSCPIGPMTIEFLSPGGAVVHRFDVATGVMSGHRMELDDQGALLEVFTVTAFDVAYQTGGQRTSFTAKR
jgi:hypothetical protein